MKLRYRILWGAGALLALSVASLAIAMSYEAACPTARSLPHGAERTKAIVRRCYGSYEVLSLEEVARPVAADDEVLIKVSVAAVNPLDWHMMTGKPYLMRLSTGFGAPDDARIGVDFAGTVEAVGGKVTRFKPGDEVFGGKRGAFAEHIVIRESGSLALKPPGLTFEAAAAIPIAAVTALQGLRDKGRIRAGQKVLVNGASGGVGTFAVQIAKAYGAHVTGVCSTRNVALVRSIGADHVIDYTKEKFVDGAGRYDLVLDTVGNHGLLELRHVLKPNGIGVIVGGPKRDPWIGPLWKLVKVSALSPFVDEELVSLMAELNPQDLNFLAELARSGKLAPVIDRRYALGEVPAALEYLAGRHARGKVVVTVAAARTE